MEHPTRFSLDRILQGAKSHPLATLAGVVGLGLVINSALSAYPAQRKPIITLPTYNRQEPSSKPKIGIGLSTSGRKIGGHIAAFNCLEDHLDLYGENGDDRFEIEGMSGGGFIGGIIKHFQKLYLQDRGVFEGLTPAQKSKQLLWENYDVFRFNSLGEIIRLNGIMDSRPIEELLKRTLDERTFNDIPNLCITAKTSETHEDVVFGQDVKDFPVWKAIMGGIGHKLALKRVKYDGQYLEDPGNDRKTPVKELFAHDYLTHRIVVYLGLNENCDLSNTNGNHSVGGFAKNTLLRYDASNAQKRRERTKQEFLSRLSEHGCLPLEHLLNAEQDDFLVMAPSHSFVPYFEAGLPTESYFGIVYSAAKESLGKYFEKRPGLNNFGGLPIRLPFVAH